MNWSSARPRISSASLLGTTSTPSWSPIGRSPARNAEPAASDALAQRFATWMQRGELVVVDPHRAATRVLAMVEGDLHRSAVIWNRAPSNDEIAANVDAAVALFLAGVRPATAAA